MDALPSQTDAATGSEISRLTDHLFRQEAGKLVSVLTGIFGIDRLQMAEDVVQEALVRAMQTWPYYGIPRNPAAWLTQTAKHLALDWIRREKVFHHKQPEIIAFIEHWAGHADDAPLMDHEIKDDRLRLMFACCHPLIPPESQTALALKTLCGFGATEIAQAFLTTEVAIAKRLTRARQKIRELRIPFEIPAGPELAARLDGVRQTLLLLFNEGYKASSGESLVREELCVEAIRLATLLAEHPAGNQPSTHALLALLCLNGARLAARVDSDGNILRLKEQDRALWDRAMISRGILHLSQSAAGDELSEYHLQAGIAACHCLAADDASTDWRQILSLYDRLVGLDASPVVALNRAVAVAHVHGPREGIAAVEAIPGRRQLESYYLLYAVLGEFEARLQHHPSAAQYFRRALDLAGQKSEQAFLAQRLRECEQAAAVSD
jgi:RNA polymerase sigma-70 factor (ECF subfamily)